MVVWMMCCIDGCILYWGGDSLFPSYLPGPYHRSDQRHEPVKQHNTTQAAAAPARSMPQKSWADDDDEFIPVRPTVQVRPPRMRTYVHACMARSTASPRTEHAYLPIHARAEGGDLPGPVPHGRGPLPRRRLRRHGRRARLQVRPSVGLDICVAGKICIRQAPHKPSQTTYPSTRRHPSATAAARARRATSATSAPAGARTGAGAAAAAGAVVAAVGAVGTGVVGSSGRRSTLRCVLCVGMSLVVGWHRPHFLPAHPPTTLIPPSPQTIHDRTRSTR